jgi:hypothetical protein
MIFGRSGRTSPPSAARTHRPRGCDLQQSDLESELSFTVLESKQWWIPERDEAVREESSGTKGELSGRTNPRETREANEY